MINSWFIHAHPGIYMRVTIFWAWVVLLLWMPIAMLIIGATEAWKFFQEHTNAAYRLQCRHWKDKHD
jgi:hypothetical protein